MQLQPSSRPCILAALLVLGGCAAASERFEFGVIGDAPYVEEDEARVAAAIEQMNRAELAFVVHVGDIQADPALPWNGGVRTCTDESLARRKELFEASRHPFILTPGDNDWTDAHRVPDRAVDPLERLARLREEFFARPESLGRRRMPLASQATDPATAPAHALYVENLTWTRAGVIFVTLHVVGSNNNLGRTLAMDAEFRARNTADLAWLADAFARARAEDARAVVVLMQANPHFETHWSAEQVARYLPGLSADAPESPPPSGFDDLLAALERETLAFARPVLLVHGDTHTFRVDKPLVRSDDGSLIANFTRVETFGYPDVHWLRVLVDPTDADVFSVRPVIVAR